MESLSISWLDLRNNCQSPGLASAFAQSYDLTVFQRYEVNLNTLDTPLHDVICFEYDYPDIPSLNLLQQMRKAYPDNPILMFTEQHSEALAIWAFRTGVWDYHVTPLSELALREAVTGLEHAQCFRCAVRQQAPDCNKVRLPDEVRFRAPPDDKQRLQPAISYLEIHYSSKLSEDALAELCGLSSSKFSRLFRQTFNITFQEYLIRYRLGESSRLLLNPVATIADVAYSVGFNDPSYYARAFKKYLGVSPSKFRQLLQENKKIEDVSSELMNITLSA